MCCDFSCRHELSDSGGYSRDSTGWMSSYTFFIQFALIVDTLNYLWDREDLIPERYRAQVLSCMFTFKKCSCGPGTDLLH